MSETKDRLVAWVPRSLVTWYQVKSISEGRSVSNLLARVLTEYAEEMKKENDVK